MTFGADGKWLKTKNEIFSSGYLTVKTMLGNTDDLETNQWMILII